MATPKHSQRNWSELANKAALLHHELVVAGLYRTGQKMHAVVQEIGYEIAEARSPELAAVHKRARVHERAAERGQQ